MQFQTTDNNITVYGFSRSPRQKPDSESYEKKSPGYGILKSCYGILKSCIYIYTYIYIAYKILKYIYIYGLQDFKIP